MECVLQDERTKVRLPNVCEMGTEKQERYVAVAVSQTLLNASPRLLRPTSYRHLRGQLLHSGVFEILHRMDHVVCFGDGAKDAAFHLDGFKRAHMEGRLARGSAVFQNDTVEAFVVRLPHRRRHTDIRGDACNDQIFDALVSEKKLKICVRKRTFTRLVDDRLLRQRIQFVNDIVSDFPAYQQTSQRSLGANSHAGCIIPRPKRLSI